MNRKMKILITSGSFGSHDPRHLEMLKQAGFEITRNPYGRLLNEEELTELLHDKDAVILSTDRLTEKVIDSCDRLKVVSRYGTGINTVDVEALKKRGIHLEIAYGANSEAVADHAVGLMLDVAHNITLTNRYWHEGKFRKRPGTDLFGSKVGIIGLGAIGKGIARRLKGFKCQIYASDVYWDEEFVSRFDIIKTNVETIFRKCEFISLNIPALEEYRGFVNSEKLGMMKPNAILINTARGDLVDREALLKALRDGTIGGYGADVSWGEPEIDEAFNEFDNVVITPHNAAVTVGAIDRMSEMAVMNVLKYIDEIKGE